MWLKSNADDCSTIRLNMVEIHDRGHLDEKLIIKEGREEIFYDTLGRLHLHFEYIHPSSTYQRKKIESENANGSSVSW